MSESKLVLTENQVKAIEEILRKGERAEIIPVKDGIKILRVVRKEYKTNT